MPGTIACASLVRYAGERSARRCIMASHRIACRRSGEEPEAGGSESYLDDQISATSKMHGLGLGGLQDAYHTCQQNQIRSLYCEMHHDVS
jgi:hypothetical protein